MRLYHHPFSSASKRVTVTAAELGITLDLINVGNILAPDNRQVLLEKNPNGRIPVLEDGDFVLWESCAIMQYLADITSNQTLYPREARERADINRWLFWASQHWTPAIGAIAWERVGKKVFGKGEPDMREIIRGETELQKLLPILDAKLSGGPWLHGAQLTLADIAISGTLIVAEQALLPLATFSNIRRWFAAIQDRPSWNAA